MGWGTEGWGEVERDGMRWGRVGWGGVERDGYTNMLQVSHTDRERLKGRKN